MQYSLPIFATGQGAMIKFLSPLPTVLSEEIFKTNFFYTGGMFDIQSRKRD